MIEVRRDHILQAATLAQMVVNLMPMRKAAPRRSRLRAKRPARGATYLEWVQESRASISSGTEVGWAASGCGNEAHIERNSANALKQIVRD
jgi:hypothetical protein